MMEDPYSLLEAMERRVLSEPTLHAEWERAWEEFGAGDDPGSRSRFREWFLLERESEALGSAPVVSWAPEDVVEDSAWECLLDSFLGIFRAVESPSEAPLHLEDLWTGRTIAVEGIPKNAVDADGLVVGRFVLAGEFEHIPLPGVFLLEVPGLMDALERDLAAIRSKDSRAKLSQRELERLLRPYFQPGAETREQLESELSALLEGQSWDLAKLRGSLLKSGADETLDRLAFETRVDLETVRRILPAYLELLTDAPAQDVAPRPQAAGPRLDPAAAVARFEAGRDQGMPLDALFEDLEIALGLERGSTREGALETNAAAAAPVPAFQDWVEEFCWERGAEGRPVGDAERRALGALSEFLAGLQAEPFDIRTLSGAHLLAFLRSLGSLEETENSLRLLEPFLRWAETQQEAPLEAVLDVAGGWNPRFADAVRWNARLREEGRSPVHRARVRTTDPLEVETETREGAPADDAPTELAAELRVGDALLGRWQQGRFRVAGWIPAETLPAAKESS